MNKADIRDLSLSKLSDWVSENGLKPFTAVQLVKWLYEQRVASFGEMSNISKVARGLLMEQFSLGLPERVAEHVSVDASVKMVFRLDDGSMIESVLMPQDGRITLCVSSQVGCAMGCTFCKTAEMKLKRNLSQSEILGQVICALDYCQSEAGAGIRKKAGRDKVSNLVFMGMGEPLHNYENVIEAIRILLDQRAFNFSKNKITVSTVGLADRIVSFGKECDARLAISLNAPRDAQREEIMPVNKRFDLKELLAACQEYGRQTGSKVTFEYVMLAGFNDRPEDAQDLSRLLAKTPSKINLIPFNPYSGSPFKRPGETSIYAFHKILADKGYQVNIRYSKGLDVMAACGQLATSVNS